MLVRHREFAFHHFEGEGFELFVFEAFDGTDRETEGDESAGVLGRNAAGHEVEDFLVADAGGGAAVGTFDLVGIDLEAGHGVGLAFVGHHEIATGLIGVGSVGSFVDENEAGEDGLALTEEGVFEEKVGMGIAGPVVLEGPLVVFLPGVGKGDGKNFRASIGAINGAVGFLADPFGTAVNDRQLG